MVDPTKPSNEDCSIEIIVMESVPRKILLKSLMGMSGGAEGALVWVQGRVEQTVGTDILIMSDGSGRAKVTRCNSADGSDKNSIVKGAYCCIIGTVLKNKGLPEIQASKFIDLTNQHAVISAWENEVKESELFMSGKIQPIV